MRVSPLPLLLLCHSIGTIDARIGKSDFDKADEDGSSLESSGGDVLSKENDVRGEYIFNERLENKTSSVTVESANESPLRLLKDELDHNYFNQQEDVLDAPLKLPAFDATSSPLLFADNRCGGEFIDLCEDESPCAGLKHIFLELCHRPNDIMTGCTSDCAYLLGQLEKEATKQGKSFECVEYVQNIPLKCIAEDTDKEGKIFQDLEYGTSCPSENDFTRVLDAGEYEVIACNELYPSGIFGTGPTYRYCMVGGDEAINTNNCHMEERELDPFTLDHFTHGHREMTSYFRSRKLDNLQEIYDGAQKVNDILSETMKVAKNAGEAAGEAYKTLESIGKITAMIGPAFQALAIVFSIVNIFLGSPESAELLYMKKEFGIVNDKLDLLGIQLDDAEERIVHEIYKSQFDVYKAGLDTCHDRLKYYHNGLSEGSQKQYYDGCCVESRSPLAFINWIENGLNDYLSTAAKAFDYQMDLFLNEANAIIFSTSMAAYFESTCITLYDLSDMVNVTQTISDRTKAILQKIETRMRELPNDYIHIQLEKDVEKIVLQSDDESICAESLNELITSRMKGWQHAPKASAYCYDNIIGWDKHAYSPHSPSENFGIEIKMRLKNKYTVAVDWTTTSYNIDLNQLKTTLKEELRDYDIRATDGSEAIYKLRSILTEELEMKYNLRLRNVHYVEHGAEFRIDSWPRKQYHIDLDPYVYCYEYNFVTPYGRCLNRYFNVIFSVYPKNEPYLNDYGHTPSSTNLPLQLCSGDCDNDTQCDVGLKCLHRNDLSPVPGCSGDGKDDYDYCIYDGTIVPSILGIGMNLYKLEKKALTPWVNSFDEAISYIAPTGAISAMHSRHDNHHEDRIFRFEETEASSIIPNHDGRLVRAKLIDRKWIYQAQLYDQHSDWSCPQNYVFIGISSVHNNQREDREVDVLCGLFDGWLTDEHESSITWENAFDAPVDFDCPISKVITGMESYHDNHYEDRRFKFTCSNWKYTGTSASLWKNNFGYSAGGWTVDKHPRYLADVNGDGMDDIVGFGYAGAYVSLSTGTSFTGPSIWVRDFGYNAGGWRVDKHPRYLADVNGDEKLDIVGFGNAGAYVSLSTLY